MSKIKSLVAEIEVIVPGKTKETSKRGVIEIQQDDKSKSGEVVITLALGHAARKELIDVLVEAPDGLKAHIVEYAEGADI